MHEKNIPFNNIDLISEHKTYIIINLKNKYYLILIKLILFQILFILLKKNMNYVAKNNFNESINTIKNKNEIDIHSKKNTN